MKSYANTTKGKAQAKRMNECRLALGCSTAKDFFSKYSNGLFSYPQYQKYESGERLLCRKASILFAQIFNVNWEWLQKGICSDKKDTQEITPNRIRELRKNKGLTQVELAEILGVTQNAIYKLETGASDLDTKWMKKLSIALEVKPYELLPLEWQPAPISEKEQQILDIVRESEKSQNTPKDKINLYKSSNKETKAG